MAKTNAFDTNFEEYQEWFEKYPAVFNSEIIAIKSQFDALPEKLNGIEVGIGIGKYALELGIKQGVEPSKTLRSEAVRNGLEVMDAAAENLPYGDMQFDFVLFVTVCHLENAKKAFQEAQRVLKKGGSVIIGFIDKNSKIGKHYEQIRAQSVFYREAWFYSLEKMEEALKEVGFKELNYVQTLFGGLDDINENQAPKEGTGEGSFVVVRAIKK